MIAFLVGLFVCVFVCLCVSPSLPFVHANLYSCGQTMSIIVRLDTMGHRTSARCDWIQWVVAPRPVATLAINWIQWVVAPRTGATLAIQ